MDRRRNKRLQNLGMIESFNFHNNNQDVVINSPLEISLIDISAGGLGIKSNIPLTEATTLSIAISYEDVNYVVIGRVVWCRREEDIYNCGLKLIYMPADLSHLIDSMIENENKYMN